MSTPLQNSTSKYENYTAAKSNLLKVVIFTDKMMNVEEIQTASYELASFICESMKNLHLMFATITLRGICRCYDFT